MYDYLIIGSGFFGSVCARELTNRGYDCLIIEKRSHIGGNCFTEDVDGINIHKYGPHIFHTSNAVVWNYVSRFTTFNNFIHRPKVSYKDKIYSFPINLSTLYQVLGTKTPTDARKLITSLKVNSNDLSNSEDYILSEIGHELYNIFIRGYTIKQWGISPKQLPSSIIKRLPIRYTFDDNYFSDLYQGIPIGGYTGMFKNMLDGIEIKLGIDYFSDRLYWDTVSKYIIYTGPIDKFYDYKFGKLDYRSLRFEHEKLDIDDYQGTAVMNYTDEKIPFTRITEHKHFEFGTQSNTIITKEYPCNNEAEPYYPINDFKNNDIYKKYKELSLLDSNVIFGGRLAEYRYYDMHQVIASALDMVDKLSYNRD